MQARISDAEVADALDRVADLLETQGADPFRVEAWRRAAFRACAVPRPLAQIVAASGRAGLLALDGIEHRTASAIEELLATGRLRTLERLERDWVVTPLVRARQVARAPRDVSHGVAAAHASRQF